MQSTKRNFLSIVIVLTFLLLTPSSFHVQRFSGTAGDAIDGPATQRLKGTWRLVSVSEEENGRTIQSSVYGSHPIGYLMYDATGHVCVQLINTDRPMWKDNDVPTPEEARSALAGFGGYCGRYEVHERERYVVHIPEADAVPNEIGHPLKRSFILRGSQLVLQAIERRVTDGRLTTKNMVWERVK